MIDNANATANALMKTSTHSFIVQITTYIIKAIIYYDFTGCGLKNECMEFFQLSQRTDIYCSGCKIRIIPERW